LERGLEPPLQRPVVILKGVYSARPELSDLVDLRILLTVPAGQTPLPAANPCSTPAKKDFSDVGKRPVRSSFAGTGAGKPRACGKCKENNDAQEHDLPVVQP
jgi:hypothetical protein